MMKVDKIFNSQKTINQMIKHVRSSLPQEQSNVLNEHLNEIKKELKQSDPRTLSIALQKLFFLRMEGIDLRSIDFAIMNCLNSNSFGPKRMACLTIPVSVDPKSLSLFMATNLFKKEIMKSNEVEVSCMLSCLTNIVTVDMAPVLIEGTLKLLKSQKPLLRKKAMALVAKIFSVCPSTIQGNLETILESVILNEENPTVLACFTSIVNSVLNMQSKLYPLFVKPLYELFNKHKSNWFMIKMIKTFHKMIKLEPRLVKKLQEPYSSILATTKSKALEYELLNSIIEFFHEDTGLYEIACDKLKVFIEHDDPNLQSLGFNLLNKMVTTNPAMINEYKQFLLDTFEGTNDIYTKISILDILENFMNASLYKEFVEVILKQINLEAKDFQKSTTNLITFSKFQARAISSIIRSTKAEDYAFVEDYNWLVSKVIAHLSKNVLSIENATQIRDLVYDLMVRVDGLSETIFKLSLQIIKGYSQGELETQPIKEDYEKHQSSTQKMLPGMKRIRASEIIFQTFLFIFGEYSHHIQENQDLFCVLELLNNSKLNQIYSHSSYEIQTALIKAIVKYSSLEKNVEGIDLKQVVELVQQIIEKQQKQEGNQLDFSAIILQGLDVYDSKLKETVQALNGLFTPFEPIHPDAQKCILNPEEIDLSVELFENPDEIMKIQQKCSAFFSIGKSKESVVSEQPTQSKTSVLATTNHINQENGKVESQNENEINKSNITNGESQLKSNQENSVPLAGEEPPKVYTVKKFAFIPQTQNGKGNKGDDEDSSDEKA